MNNVGPECVSACSFSLGMSVSTKERKEMKNKETSVGPVREINGKRTFWLRFLLANLYAMLDFYQVL